MAILRPCRSRRITRLAILAIGLLSLSGAVARAQQPGLEWAVKANYLYKFAPFVAWPSGSDAGPGNRFTVCVLGDDPFGSILDQSVRGQSVAGRPIIVHRLGGSDPARGCQILFIGRTRQRTAEVLKALAGQPVLTVTDPLQGSAGGMIQFILKDGRVRFDIDAEAAQAAGLTISSKLLSLAVTVRRGAR